MYISQLLRRVRSCRCSTFRVNTSRGEFSSELQVTYSRDDNRTPLYTRRDATRNCISLKLSLPATSRSPVARKRVAERREAWVNALAMTQFAAIPLCRKLEAASLTRFRDSRYTRLMHPDLDTDRITAYNAVFEILPTYQVYL